ncbi:hypothetical protein [Loigolactobacillus coryniformis]|uniref:Uncharacterized protein n=1 Tax=Loigolactobacillus coryniformis subsp. torquens DSM 20004 = KCTC 3535 TaxID=1423822 RepID=A0A2D1KMC4_9LACO|nr:hypothetical protein [Loigolactobacillus coryniformis]ATO43305.1 hypothetical protein LC20004_05030 [Loigolactobacillus coryniformis subsp. torquens DSM 20004 = KCTC 3535]KRK85620.1 hypothetical protein FC16_GL000012 [Loigolactobacillus coryniformis subsp. torquens DSM 20004 = KCTC 3535]
MNLSVDLTNEADIKQSIIILQGLIGGQPATIAGEQIVSGTVSANKIAPNTNTDTDTPDSAHGVDFEAEPKANQKKAPAEVTNVKAIEDTVKDDIAKVTKEMVQKRMKTMLREQKRAEMVEALSEFGVKKLSEMTADAYPKFYTKMGELL